MRRTIFDTPVINTCLHRLALVGLRLFGWQVVSEPPQPRKFVLIAAPHTSNWDLLVMLAVAFSYQTKIFWMGKHTLFRWPLGVFFKWLGGIPNTWPRFIGGRARFTAAALWALTKSRKVPVALRCDQAETARIQSEFFVVANGRFAGGGMMFAPQASLADGLLDIMATDDITRWDILKELPRLQRGTHIQHPKVKSLRAQQVEVTSETPLAVDVDGELAGYTPVRLTVLPAAVRFFVASDLAGEC